MLLAAGYTLLLFSWAVANPPFAAPDEPAHYLRAIAVGGGSLGGSASVRVPAGLWATGDPACNKFEPARSAGCVDRLRPTTEDTTATTGQGFYPPLAYVLPGAASRATSDLRTAVLVARLVTVAISSALFLWTALLVYVPAIGPPSLLGLVVATSPMVVFVCSIENNSALETAAGLTFAAAVLSVARARRVPVMVWIAVATSGALMALSRSTGILWLAFGVAVACGLMGRARLLELVKNQTFATTATGVVLACAVAGNRAWEQEYGSEVTRAGPLAYPWTDKVAEALRFFDPLAREWVGVFGWLDTELPIWAMLLWIIIGAELALAAFLLGSRRERWVFCSALVMAASAAVLLSATLRAGELGGNVQARHLMPFLVMLPLLAGEIATRARSNTRHLQGLFLTATAATALVHVIAWYVNARRHAVGTDGSVFFFPHQEWSPPLGWVTWSLVTVAGASLTVLSARFRPGPRRPFSRAVTDT